MKKVLIAVIAVIILLVGLGLILYPSLSDYYNRVHRSSAIVDYAEKISAFDSEQFDEMWDRAVAYNQQLFDLTKGIEPDPETAIAYESVLNVTESGMMAYVDVPKINCHLPVYHGIDEDTLQSNAGHLESSSLPVGGENTHCVISGHTGLPSAKLFTDLDSLQKGDVFMLTTLGVILTYEVDQIVVALPWEVEALAIVPGKDYCTLATCTPYGVNSHRLFVRGHRIETTQILAEEVKTFQQAQEADLKTPFIVTCGIVAIIILSILALLIIRHMIAAKKADAEEQPSANKSRPRSKGDRK